MEPKVEAAYQTLNYLTADENFRNIQMETAWKLLETCVIPLITYGAETWDYTKTQMKRVNTILDNIIKRILMIPQSTPRESIYHQLQIKDIEHRIKEKKLLYRINKIEKYQESEEQPKGRSKLDEILNRIEELRNQHKDVELKTAEIIETSTGKIRRTR